MTTTPLPHLASRLFGTPLLVARTKLDAILAALAPRLGVVAPEAIGSPSVKQRASYAVTEDGIAVVSILGTLVRRAHGMDALSGLTSYEAIGRELETALAAPDVSAILLDVDSPGGEAQGVFDLADRIRLAQLQKPIWAVANEDAFSAAYALASAAERVYLPRTGGVGSVGVVALHLDRSERDAKDGLRYTYLYAGAEKVAGQPHAPLDERARTSIQAEVDRIHDLFVTTVARFRGLSPDAVRATEAALFMGPAAVSNGLADHLGTKDEALAALRAYLAGSGAPTATRAQAAEIATLQGRLTERNATIARLEQRLAELEAAEIDDYLDGLQTGSAAANAPIRPAELERVRALFAAGQGDTARLVGDALLRASEAQAQPSFERVRTERLEETPRTTSPARAEAVLLRAAGWTVELDPAGAEIVRAVPPGREE